MATSTEDSAAIQIGFKPHNHQSVGTPVGSRSHGDEPEAMSEKKAERALLDLVPQPAVALDVFADGDIPFEWKGLVATSSGTYPLQGHWEIDLELSESCDHIFAALGVGALKRAFLRTYKTKVTIEIVAPSENVPPSGGGGVVGFHLVTTLPMGHTKEATIPSNGQFSQYDPDTKAEWTNLCVYNQGVLKQRRTSSLGVMYDVRCVFNRHPQGRVKNSTPLMLFKWTFIGKDGKRLGSNRWLRKVPST